MPIVCIFNIEFLQRYKPLNVPEKRPVGRPRKRPVADLPTFNVRDPVLLLDEDHDEDCDPDHEYTSKPEENAPLAKKRRRHYSTTSIVKRMCVYTNME